MDKPHRAVTLALKMDADSRKEMATALRNFAFDVETGESKSGACGGVSSGYAWEIVEHNGPTHEEYVEQINEYLEKGTESYNA